MTNLELLNLLQTNVTRVEGAYLTLRGLRRALTDPDSATLDVLECVNAAIELLEPVVASAVPDEKIMRLCDVHALDLRLQGDCIGGLEGGCQ